MSGIQALSQQVGIDTAKRLDDDRRDRDRRAGGRAGPGERVHDEPFVAATRFLEEVATRSPDSVAATKRLFGRTLDLGDRRTFARERFEQARLLATRNTTIAREAA